MERKSGILMHISSLPSPWGIGTFGRDAYAFVDFLSMAGQSYWQLLPMGPTSVFDSPYQSFSTYAGNPYFIDPDMLCHDGLLDKEDYIHEDFGSDPGHVDFGKLYERRYPMLRRAYERGRDKLYYELRAFEASRFWLPDYALFMALKEHFGGEVWTRWPEDIRMRKPDTIARFRLELAQDIDFHIFVQYCFFSQWDRLRSYVRQCGIKLIGDLPIYVPLDSADVWSSPELFQLDDALQPTAVAGVPPDYFTTDGQLWGNPLYDWDAMQNTGYRWWIDRVRAAGGLYDLLRIDHFRGLASYWKVPAGAPTAKTGVWVKGPGMDLISALYKAVPEVKIIAEDLGYLTDDVIRLREQAKLPGMKIMEFAFDSREASDYLPHNYERECICYTGTHDNTTAAGWFEDADPQDVNKAIKYLGLNDMEGYANGLIRGGMSSVAMLFIAQIQDHLGVGNQARMNTPGTVGHGNWTYRVLPGELTGELAARIFDMTQLYGRL